MSEARYEPIGVVHSPFKVPQNVPIQAAAAKGIKGTVELIREYVKGLKDLEGIFAYTFVLSLSPIKTLLFNCKTVFE